MTQQHQFKIPLSQVPGFIEGSCGYSPVFLAGVNDGVANLDQRVRAMFPAVFSAQPRQIGAGIRWNGERLFGDSIFRERLCNALAGFLAVNLMRHSFERGLGENESPVQADAVASSQVAV